MKISLIFKVKNKKLPMTSFAIANIRYLNFSILKYFDDSYKILKNLCLFYPLFLNIQRLSNNILGSYWIFKNVFSLSNCFQSFSQKIFFFLILVGQVFFFFSYNSKLKFKMQLRKFHEKNNFPFYFCIIH